MGEVNYQKGHLVQAVHPNEAATVQRYQTSLMLTVIALELLFQSASAQSQTNPNRIDPWLAYRPGYVQGQLGQGQVGLPTGGWQRHLQQYARFSGDTELPSLPYLQANYAYRATTPNFIPYQHQTSGPSQGVAPQKPFQNAISAPTVFQRFPSLRQVPTRNRKTGEIEMIWWVY